MTIGHILPLTSDDDNITNEQIRELAQVEFDPSSTEKMDPKVHADYLDYFSDALKEFDVYLGDEIIYFVPKVAPFLLIDKDLTVPQLKAHLTTLAEAKAENADEFWPWPIEDEIAAFNKRITELERVA